MTPLLTVIEKDPEILSVVDKARALTINTPEQASYVDEFCVWLKDLEKRTTAKYADSKKKAHDAWKAVVAMESEDLDKVIEARKIAKSSLIAWDDKQKAIAEQNAAIARAKAKKDAEDAALLRAEIAEEYGDKAGAEAIINAPVVVEPVKVAAPAKTATMFQTRWKFKIVDASKIPREYLVPDETKIGGVIRATKGAVTIPGVEAFSERV